MPSFGRKMERVVGLGEEFPPYRRRPGAYFPGESGIPVRFQTIGVRWGVPKSIPAGAYCRGLGLGVGCGLVFRVAFGLGCSAFAVVSFSIVAGSRPLLVLVVLVARRFRSSTLLVSAYCMFCSIRVVVASFVLIVSLRFFRS